MDTSSPKQQDDRRRFVEPSLRPSAQQPSRCRVIFGVALLVVGFVAIFLGCSDAFEQALLIGGSILVVASLLVFRPGSRVGLQQAREKQDMHNLYGTNKA